MPALRPCDARPEGRLRLHLPELRFQGFLLLLNDVLFCYSRSVTVPLSGRCYDFAGAVLLFALR